MTTSIRLHVPNPLADGAAFAVGAEQAHYLGAVMRCGAGDVVTVFNGRDGEWSARIVRVRRDHIDLMAETCLRIQASGGDMWLAFALLKRTATDFLVQKATELGVARLLPVTTARTNADRINPERLARIAREAAEQSERLDIPQIAAPCTLSELLATWPTDRRLHAAIERSDAPRAGRAAGPAALLIGPEGGFTSQELDGLRAHPFVLPVSLGPLVLRAETAAIVGLALLAAPA